MERAEANERRAKRKRAESFHSQYFAACDFSALTLLADQTPHPGRPEHGDRRSARP
jgi:hypothetical protein